MSQWIYSNIYNFFLRILILVFSMLPTKTSSFILVFSSPWGQYCPASGFVKILNKLGLSWAKLSSRLDWALFQLICIKLKQLSQPQLAIASCSQWQLVINQTTSLIVLVEQTIFPFYTIIIQLEIPKLALASYCQLQLGVAIGLVVTSQTTSPNIYLVSRQTFLFNQF